MPCVPLRACLCHRYGLQSLVVANALDEEVERELEEELETVRERVLPARKEPCPEADWDWATGAT